MTARLLPCAATSQRGTPPRGASAPRLGGHLHVRTGSKQRHLWGASSSSPTPHIPPHTPSLPHTPSFLPCARPAPQSPVSPPSPGLLPSPARSPAIVSTSVSPDVGCYFSFPIHPFYSITRWTTKWPGSWAPRVDSGAVGSVGAGSGTQLSISALSNQPPRQLRGGAEERRGSRRRWSDFIPKFGETGTRPC